MPRFVRPGVPTFDLEATCTCFRCDVQRLAKALIESHGYQIVGTGVGHQDAILTRNTLRLIRYDGSDWSSIVPGYLRSIRQFDQEVAKAISRSLQVDALVLGIHDTAGESRYEYIRNGVTEEYYMYSTDESECEAHSQSRELSPAELGLEHIDRFLTDLGVIPALTWSPFEKLGKPVRAQSELDAAWEDIAEFALLDKSCG